MSDGGGGGGKGSGESGGGGYSDFSGGAPMNIVPGAGSFAPSGVGDYSFGSPGGTGSSSFDFGGSGGYSGGGADYLSDFGGAPSMPPSGGSAPSYSPPPGTGGAAPTSINVGGVPVPVQGQASTSPMTSLANPTGALPGAAASGPGATAFAAPAGVGGGGDPTANPNPSFEELLQTGGASTGATSNAPSFARGGASVPSVSPAAAAPAPGGSGGGGFSLENILGSALGSVAKNPLGIAAAAGGLGYNMSQNQARPSTQTIEQQAAMLNANGKQLMAYLQSGDLPPGLKASLDQATKAAKAKVISNFATQGMSTDPSQNSALGQMLAQIDQQAIITTAQIGQQLMATGVQQSGMASDLYKTLSNIDQTQTANIGKAIASMAAAFNPQGQGGGVNLRLG